MRWWEEMSLKELGGESRKSSILTLVLGKESQEEAGNEVNL